MMVLLSVALSSSRRTGIGGMDIVLKDGG